MAKHCRMAYFRQSQPRSIVRFARPHVPRLQLAAIDHHRERAPHLDLVIGEGDGSV
jgi:hypothetical protein